MNYKFKWIFNWLVFPLISLLPMVVLLLVNSFEGDILLPSTTSYVLVLFFIYLVVYFLLLGYLFLDNSFWRRLSGRDYFFLGIFATILALITTFDYFVITYFSVLNFEKNQTLLIIGLVLIATIIGSYIYQFAAKVAIDRLSFSGQKNLVTHRLGYRYAPSTFFKNWLFLVDAWFKDIEEKSDEDKTYSLLLTNKALFIIDYFLIDDQTNLTFASHIKKHKKETVVYQSLLTASNFEYASIRENNSRNPNDQVKDLFSDFSEAPSFVLINPEINFDPQEEIIVTYLEKLNASNKVAHILNKRNNLIESLKSNLHLFSNLNPKVIDELPIINVLLLENDEIKVEGEHSDVMVCSEETFLEKIVEVNKLISGDFTNEMREVRKIIKNNI